MSTGQAGGADLDERYGRTPQRRRWNRRGVWAAAAAFAVVLTAWVIWAGVDQTTTSVDILDTGYKVVDERSVRVTWQITTTPGESAKCALQAQNESHAIVGWKLVDIAASDQRTRAFTEVVKTTELAVTGLIYRCWLA